MTDTKNTKDSSTKSPFMIWSIAAIVGFVLGGFLTLLPFYFHALNDWDLSNDTLFPPEALLIVLHYSPGWLTGAVIGAVLFVAISVGLTIFRKKKVNEGDS